MSLVPDRCWEQRPVRRRAAAIVAFVAALLIIGTFGLVAFSLTASINAAALGHFYSTAAFYAAEGGLEMALRELTRSPPQDTDSDGGIGTISDNGNPADDPALDSGVFRVEQAGTSPPLYRAVGRPVGAGGLYAGYRRVVEIRLQ